MRLFGKADADVADAREDFPPHVVSDHDVQGVAGTEVQAVQGVVVLHKVGATALWLSALVDEFAV